MPDRELLLDVRINGRAIGMLGEFSEHDGQLSATRHELDLLGFKLPATIADADKLSLKIPGVDYRLDERTQTIFFNARQAALKPTVVSVQKPPTAEIHPSESGIGAVANYAVTSTMTPGQQTVTNGLLDARVFSPWGVADTSMIGTSGATADTPSVVRLDSSFTRSDTESLRRYRVGDVIAGGLAWSRSVRIGGVQVTTDFAMRPDLITFPTPTIVGQVAVASSADVLVNGVRLLSSDLPPGPFQVSQLPIVTGTGEVSVVLRNAVGQETTQTLPIYASNLLLAPGLSSFSAELGVVRLNYGQLSADYHAPVALLTYRHGVLDWLTLEGHGEGSAGGGSYGGLATASGGLVGAGSAFTVGSLGVVALGAAASAFAGRSGALLSASFERIAPVLSVAGSIQATTSGFGDVAATYGDPFPRLATRASVGLALGQAGSLGIAYVGLQRPASQVSRQVLLAAQRNLQSVYNLPGVNLLPANKVSLVSVSYSRPVLRGRAYLYATGFRDFASASALGVLAGVTFPLGRDGTASVSGGGGGGKSYASIQANRPANFVGDVGWQVQESVGRPAQQLAVGEYRSAWGLVDAGVNRTDGQTAVRGSVQGSVTLASGGVFLGNTIYDSFAIVDTGAENITVLQENRPVGRTGSSGQLLIPSLRSYDANRIGIEPSDVPIDADVGQTERLIWPQDRSGVVVRFPIQRSAGAIVKLVDVLGVPIAIGSRARLAGLAEPNDVIIGYDGEAYVKGLQLHNRMTVTQLNNRPCFAAFDYHPIAGALPHIGPIRCLEPST